MVVDWFWGVTDDTVSVPIVAARKSTNSLRFRHVAVAHEYWSIPQDRMTS